MTGIRVLRCIILPVGEVIDDFYLCKKRQTGRIRADVASRKNDVWLTIRQTVATKVSNQDSLRALFPELLSRLIIEPVCVFIRHPDEVTGHRSVLHTFEHDLLHSSAQRKVHQSVRAADSIRVASATDRRPPAAR